MKRKMCVRGERDNYNLTREQRKQKKREDDEHCRLKSLKLCEVSEKTDSSCDHCGEEEEEEEESAKVESKIFCCFLKLSSGTHSHLVNPLVSARGKTVTQYPGGGESASERQREKGGEMYTFIKARPQ